jgi:hypothetical protein
LKLCVNSMPDQKNRNRRTSAAKSDLRTQSGPESRPKRAHR